MNNMKTKVWLNLDPQKVDVSYLYKKFDEIGCDFEAEAIPDNTPELLIKKVKDVDIVIATMEPWNETTLGAVKGKVKFIQKYGTGVDSVDLKAAGKNGIPVANIPGAVPCTSTLALTNATLPYAIRLADLGWEKACENDPGLKNGLNIVNGKIVFPAVAEAFGWKI